MPQNHIQARVTKLRQRLVARHIARLALLALAWAAIGLGALTGLIGLLAWAGLAAIPSLAGAPLSPSGSPVAALIVLGAVWLACFFVMAWRRAAPNRETAEVLLDFLAGSPGSVPLAARGIGGAAVAESAQAAIRRSNDAGLAPVLDGRTRGWLGLALVVLLGGGLVLETAPAAKPFGAGGADTSPRLVTGADRETASSGPHNAGADALAALRDQMLGGTADQRAAAAARYAELWRRAGDELNKGLKQPDAGKQVMEPKESAVDRAQAAATAMGELAEAGVAAGSGTQQAIEAAIAKHGGVAGDEAKAAEWLEANAGLIGELLNAGEKAIGDAERIVRSGGAASALVARPGGAGEPGGAGASAAGNGHIPGSNRAASDPPGSVEIPIPAPGTAPPTRAGNTNRAAMAGARYLAALEKGRDSQPNRQD